MTKPITTEEFFCKICSILREKEEMPDILDYALPALDPVSMTTYEVTLRNDLNYGANEGIYLDIRITVTGKEKEGCQHLIGTFKTLDTSPEAMHTMGCLLADFIVEGYFYINSHLDDFTWEEFNVNALDKTREKICQSFTCRDVEQAWTKAATLLEEYPHVIIRDNSTRKEILLSYDVEIAFQYNKGYFAIQETVGGFDYSFYDNKGNLLDGGIYDNPDISIVGAAKDILSDAKIDLMSCRMTDYDELMEKAGNANLYF